MKTLCNSRRQSVFIHCARTVLEYYIVCLKEVGSQVGQRNPFILRNLIFLDVCCQECAEWDFYSNIQANQLFCHSVMEPSEDRRFPGQRHHTMGAACPHLLLLSPKLHGVIGSSPGACRVCSVFASWLRNFELRKPNLLKGLQAKLSKREIPCLPTLFLKQPWKVWNQSCGPLLTRRAETCDTHGRLSQKLELKIWSISIYNGV